MKAITAAFSHKDYLGGAMDASFVEKNWATIEAAGEALVAGVQLPVLQELDFARSQLANPE